MSSSTSEVTGSSSRAALRWPLGPWMLTLLVLTTIGAAGLLGSMADPMITVGMWGYAVWPAAAIVALLAVGSAARLAGGGPAREPLGPPTPAQSLAAGEPPVVQRFRHRMGGWGSYVAVLSQFVGMIGVTAVVAMVVAGTLLPGGGPAARIGAVIYLGALVLARVHVPEPHRMFTLVVVAAAVSGLVGIAAHLEAVESALGPEAARPRAPVLVPSVLEATALLPLAFLPLVRMSVMLPGLSSSRQRRWVRRWVIPLTAAAAAGVGALLGGAVEGMLDPASAAGTALIDAVSEGPPAVGLAVRIVTLVLGTVITLVLLADIQVVGGHAAGLSAIRDVFTPASGRRASVPGELLVLALGALAVVLTPTTRDLIAFSAFCILVLFGSLHVAALRPRGNGRHPIAVLAMVGLLACITLAFSLPPEVVLAGIALVSLAVSLRAVFIVWSEPVVPDIVEGVAPSDASAAPTGGAEDAPRDLPPDHRAGRPQHRAEG